MREVLWGAMDEDTMDMIENSEDAQGKLDEDSDWKRIREWIGRRQERNKCREKTMKSRRGKDDMDVGRLAEAEEGDDKEAENQEECKECESGLSEFVKGGKAGAKGGGKPFTCFTCGGEGHPARLCPTVDPNAKHICNNCKGVGHFARDCTSAGGGQHGKAGGKGDGKAQKGYGQPKGGGYGKGGGKYGGGKYGGYGKGGNKGGGYGKGQILEMDTWGWTGSAESQEEQPWMTGEGNTDNMYSMGQGQWNMPRSMSSLQENKTKIKNNEIFVKTDLRYLVMVKNWMMRDFRKSIFLRKSSNPK